MADVVESKTEVEGGNPVVEQPSAIQRPETLPETYWDPKAGSAKFDEIGKALTERESLLPLKTAAEARAKDIPAKPEDYKLDLPKDFPLPAGKKWNVHPDDPLAKAFIGYATEQKMPQSEMTGLVTMWAILKVQQDKADQEFYAAEKTAMGTNADQRISAARTFLDGNLKQHSATLAPLLATKAGVEAVEALQAKLSGVQMRGGPVTPVEEKAPKSAADVLYGH